MKNITTSILVVLMVCSAFSSSSDDSASSNSSDSESDFFIKAKVDGEERLFNVENFMSAQMRSFPVNDLYELAFEATISGELGQGMGEGSIEGIGLGFNLDTPITVGVYNQPEDLPVGFFHARIVYQNVGLSSNIGKTLFVTDINDPVSSLEITELTQNTIKGKFSGIVQNPIVENDIVITDGEFFLELFIGDE